MLHRLNAVGKSWLPFPFSIEVKGNVSQSTIRRRFREQQYRGYTTRCKVLISSKNQKATFANKYRDEPLKFWNKFYGLRKPWLTSTKMMERPKCGERRALLMIQNIQAHFWSTVEGVSWLGLTNLYWWWNS